MNENATVRLAQEGNRDAFRRLYEEHRERIFRLAFRYTRSEEDAEDVMQETFVRAFKELHSYVAEGDSSFAAWITTIGLHCAAAHLRRMKSRKKQDQVSLDDLAQEPASADPEPDRAAAASRALAMVRSAQDGLSPRQRIIFD